MLCILKWTPEGRRLVTGASSGEFTLWNGLTFNFETILQVSPFLFVRIPVVVEQIGASDSSFGGLVIETWVRIPAVTLNHKLLSTQG